MPIEPPPTTWRFPDAASADPDGIVGVGADLEPGTLLAAYREGLFPMPLATGRTIGWWSPDPRGIVPLAGRRPSRSLRQAKKRYEVRIDTAFAEVVDACADPGRPGGWITPGVAAAYVRLHELGWAHSVETWDDAGLAGGLYGVAVGGLFAGESMFYSRSDASKVAFLALLDVLREDGADRLLDVQWTTPHLATLGAIEVPRAHYLVLLDRARALPVPPRWR